ncbi:MAG: hypoxanthine phosphoribosyltransferase [Cyclobacteriaceae bacterium]
MSIDTEVVLHDKRFELFLTEKEIKNATEKLAKKINEDYHNDSVVIVGVLDGVFMVLADILKKLKMSVSLELIKMKSYQGLKSTGQVNKIIGLTSDLKGQKVIVIEDIIDTGNTLATLLEELSSLEPVSIDIATLLLKPEVFKERFPIRYIGQEIPDRFVVGYGMDYDGEGRQLPNIYVLKES